MKVSQSEDELLGYLKDQMTFLKNSANSYDKGFEGDAIRLAAVIRVLVHDTSKSTSLLTLLGKKDAGFYDTANDYFPDNLVSEHCLVMMRLGPSAIYVAPLDDLPSDRKDKKIPFDEWWDKKVVSSYVEPSESDKSLFTRKDLVLNVANTQGGAHVDPQLDEAYANLFRFASSQWAVVRPGYSGGMENNPVLASVRQIAHEVIRTLTDEFPDL